MLDLPRSAKMKSHKKKVEGGAAQAEHDVIPRWKIGVNEAMMDGGILSSRAPNRAVLSPTYRSKIW